MVTAGKYGTARLMQNIAEIRLEHIMLYGWVAEHFREYLKAAAGVGYRVTLLGYKTNGRGKDVVPFPYEWWVDEVSALVASGMCPSLSIDTPLAGEWAGRMPVDKALYHTEEGKFSMYIDAVALTYGASSFENKTNLLPLIRIG